MARPRPTDMADLPLLPADEALRFQAMLETTLATLHRVLRVSDAVIGKEATDDIWRQTWEDSFEDRRVH